MSFSKESRFTWSGFALEVLSIVIGVLLALMVNEFREYRNEQQLVRDAFQSIAMEVEANKEFIETRIPYWRELSVSLDSLVSTHGPDRLMSDVNIPGFRGFNPPILNAASFETAIASQALRYMDFGVANGLSRLYSFQSFYLKIADTYMGSIIQGNRTSISQARAAVVEMLTVGTELVSAYDQVLDGIPR